MEPITRETLPPEDSGRGDNAYYIPSCEVVQHSPAYAACLNKIKRTKAGDTSPLFTDCSKKISGQGCKATRMQREELAEGRALYYLPRARVQEAIAEYDADVARRAYAKYGNFDRDLSPEAMRKKARTRLNPAPIPAAPPEPKSVLDGLGADYTAALNRAVAAERKTEPLPGGPVAYTDGEGNAQVCVGRVVEKDPPPATAGSALERARAMLAAKRAA